VQLPPDNHVHSEYSWDALAGSMAVAVARAAGFRPSDDPFDFWVRE
jgi:hypothetical protein